MKVSAKVEFQLETDDYVQVQPNLVDAHSLVVDMLGGRADLPEVRQITVREATEFEKHYVVIVEDRVDNSPCDETHLIGVYSDLEKAKAEVTRLIGKNKWDEEDPLPGIVFVARDLDENMLYMVCETGVDGQSDWKK